jgi:hypothetical protein
MTRICFSRSELFTLEHCKDYLHDLSIEFGERISSRAMVDRNNLQVLEIISVCIEKALTMLNKINGMPECGCNNFLIQQ